MLRLRWRRTGVGVLVAAALGSGAGNAEQSPAATRHLELADYYRFETASSPAISPDGRQVAFVRTFIVEDENRRHTEIWLAPTDGSSAPIRLTHSAFSSSAPRWSPDGALLAFSSRRKVPGSDEKNTVWFLRMDRPAGEAFQIAGVTGPPVFSPDNKWIAFTTPTPPDPQNKPQHASEAERKISKRFKGRIIDWIQYRDDGRGYLSDPRDPAATPPRELYIVPRSGGTPKRLTSLNVDVEDVAWRPDSQALAFVADGYQRDEYVYERADVWTVNLEGVTKRLTDDGYNHSAAAWSPDGRTLVVRRQQGLSAVIAARESHGAQVDLYRMPAEGGKMENLTAEWDLLPGNPVWSLDGRFIFFTGGVRGSAHLFKGAAQGGRVDQVSGGERRLESVTFSSSFDRIAYTAGDSSRPEEVYAARLDGTELVAERRLSSINDAAIHSLDLGRIERVRYPSKDGTEIDGWVVLPPDYDVAKGPYPLILSIHGGPHGAYGNDFSFMFRLLAANGYIVLYTNPRGSTGYGEKFLWATWGGWGNLDYDDVMAGVDDVAAKYPVDQKRLGVTGYSYGGFLTNWIITKTSRFAAAVTGAGISNWISDYGTADIPRTKESEFFGAPWDARGAELLLKQSPIMHAGNVTTPTLFVHGESDARVPIEQAEQMYLALKKRRVPARFIRYPDMYHGNWAPWNTVHRYAHELQWWDQYLGRRTKATQ